IHFIRDESDRAGMRIVIELKKDAIPQIVLNKLFSYTQLQETVGVIMIAIVNGEPKLLNLKQILHEYLKFQYDVIVNRTLFDLKKAKARAHILTGLVLAVDFIDEVLSILRSSSSIPDGKNRLMERFADTDITELVGMKEYHGEHETGLSPEQADAIVQMRFGQLTGLERQKLIDELGVLTDKINELTEILEDDSRIYGIIRDELGEIRRKYSDDRRTAIESVSGEVDIEDLIPEEDCVVAYTNIGYIKRVPVDVYKTQKRGGKGVSGMKQREEDFVNEMFIASSHDSVLFISNKGIMYKLKCYEVPEGSKGSRGVNIVNLLPLSDGEKISAMIKTTDFDAGKYITMVTKNGKIKRTNLSEYRNVRKKGLIAIGLDEGDEIAGVRMTDGSADLMIATRKGMIIRISEDDIRALSRSAHGVKAIRLHDGDEVVSMARVREGASLLTVSDRGFGKRTPLDAYRVQSRGGLGLKNYKVSDEKGDVCGIKVVDETDDIILISDSGVIIRVRAADISLMSRYAAGVRIMRLNGDESRVAAFTRAEHDEDDEAAEE
ncbi:MAG TPA: DNA gyrase subunit A, partial [Ruminococcus sp.]|nr:DNA gyrase subunit A [Ruminococcus sp.]